MSNVIKPYSYVKINETLTIDPVVYRPSRPAGEHNNNDDYTSESELLSREAADKLISEAKLAAEEQLRLATEETIRMKEQAADEIERWWNERRIEDIQAVEESKVSGFEAGYKEGLTEAEREAKEQYESLIQEAAKLIEEAHRMKESIIAEAEPFLVELSLGIARKIIGSHIEGSPEWTTAHVKKTLERRREKGIITLCVSPAQFGRMQDARAELSLSIDSQAELQIVPDHTVDEGGCVVRTSFGSIDARIDTQLSELKAALLEVALSGESEGQV